MAGYLWSAAVQFTISVIAVDAVSSTNEFTRNRWPSAETSYGNASSRTCGRGRTANNGRTVPTANSAPRLLTVADVSVLPVARKKISLP
jgi:hypothetical protein